MTDQDKIEKARRELEVIRAVRDTLNRAYSFVLESSDKSVVTEGLPHGKYTVLGSIEQSLQAISQWPLPIEKGKRK